AVSGLYLLPGATQDGPDAPDPCAPRQRRLPGAGRQGLQRPRPVHALRPGAQPRPSAGRSLVEPAGTARLPAALPAPADAAVVGGRGAAAGRVPEDASGATAVPSGALK